MEENKNEILIFVPLELFQMLVSRSEQIAVIERMTEKNGYIALNDLRAIIAASPLPERNEEAERRFDKMFEDVPGMEEMTCT
ncbi:MAG: hypothetical protein HFI26_16265 [Lachnospiraceae bacterium]|jgi:hypothetical protein|nr:hypothetical protein [Lachnospiraceae bacterium]